MGFKMINFFLKIFVIFFIVSSVFAIESNKEALLQGINIPYKLDIKNPKKRELFVLGRFTYWQPLEDMVELSSDLNLSNLSFEYVNFPVKFEPGFKVGIGTETNYDNWQVFCEYTYFRGSNKKDQKLSGDWSQLFWLSKSITQDFLDGFIDSVSGKWDVNLDKFTIALQRPYFLSNQVLLNTSFGFTSYWLSQDFNVFYIFKLLEIEFRPKTEIHSSPWAIGPRIGIDLNWQFSQRFSIIANGYLSTSYNIHRLSGETFNLISDIEFAPGIELKRLKHKMITFNPEIALGFDWNYYFANNNAHFNISAKYEMQIYTNQNYLAPYMQSIGVLQVLSLIPPGNLFFHGPTLTMRFDF